MLSYKKPSNSPSNVFSTRAWRYEKETAVELWKIAKEYQEEAAKLDGGREPDVSELSPWLKDSPR
jgi:hypothetical protein